jgi:2-isopropylmalate synthase
MLPSKALIRAKRRFTDTLAAKRSLGRHFMVDRVIIFDTTLRDGEQAPGFSMNIDDKLRMARQLEQLNVDIIEAGFPIASEGDFEAVRVVAKEVRTPTIAGFARAVKKDIDRCAQALEHANKARIHVFLATSDIHLKYKLNKTREDALAAATESVRYARTLCDDVEFAAEDAGRTDLDFLIAITEAVIDAGASTVNIPDTVGYCIPEDYGRMIRNLRSRVNNIDRAIISTHCHNDLGLAVANSLAAVQNGARQVECTINGIGERAGNAALEEVVMAFHVRQQAFGVTTNINTKELSMTSRLLREVTSMRVQANKAIVGDNAFAHEAGIHQDGMLQHAGIYEIMTPETVGIPQGTLVLGKHSGRNALVARCRSLGFQPSHAEVEHAYSLLTAMTDKKKTINDTDLQEIIHQTRH